MTRLVWLAALAACGGGTAAQPAPKRASEPAPVVEAAPASPPAAAPAEPPHAQPAVPPPVQKPPIWDRLGETDGPVPGLTGFSLSHKPDAQRCGGVAIVTKRPAHAAKGDAELAALYE